MEWRWVKSSRVALSHFYGWIDKIYAKPSVPFKQHAPRQRGSPIFGNRRQWSIKWVVRVRPRSQCQSSSTCAVRCISLTGQHSISTTTIDSRLGPSGEQHRNYYRNDTSPERRTFPRRTISLPTSDIPPAVKTKIWKLTPTHTRDPNDPRREVLTLADPWGGDFMKTDTGTNPYSWP